MKTLYHIQSITDWHDEPYESPINAIKTEMGQFKLYDKEYAATSTTGWYEIMKISAKEWAVLECYPDGSADYRTFEPSKVTATSAAKRMAKFNNTVRPYFVDHGVRYYNIEAF